MASSRFPYLIVFFSICVYMPIPIIRFVRDPVRVETIFFEGVALAFYFLMGFSGCSNRTRLATEGFFTLATLAVFYTRALSLYTDTDDSTGPREVFFIVANATLLRSLAVLSHDDGVEPPTDACTRLLGNKCVRWTLGPALYVAGGVGALLAIEFLWVVCWEFGAVAAVVWSWAVPESLSLVPITHALFASNVPFMLQRVLDGSLDGAPYNYSQVEDSALIGLGLMVIVNFILILSMPYPQPKGKSYFTALHLSCGAFMGFAGFVMGHAEYLYMQHWLLWWELGFGVFVFLFIAASSAAFRGQAIVFVSIATVFPGTRLFAWLDGGLDTKIGIGSLVTVVSHLLLIGALGFEQTPPVPPLIVAWTGEYSEPDGTSQSAPLASPQTLAMIRIESEG